MRTRNSTGLLPTKSWVFWVFPNKTGIESRKSMTFHITDAGTRRPTGPLLEKTWVSHTNGRFRGLKRAQRQLHAPPQQTGRCRWVPPRWGLPPDTSDRIAKVETRNPASQLPEKSWGFSGFPIQNGNWETEVHDRPQRPRDESGPAVHVRQMSVFPCGGRHSQSQHSSSYRSVTGKNLGFPYERPVFGD